MNYKDDNTRRLRSLDEQWRREAQARKFDADVERARYRAAVRHAAKGSVVPRETPKRHPALVVLYALCFVCKILVVGTLICIGGLIAAIIGASKHR